METIENKLGKYIDRAERREQYSCARICVEVDLEIGLPEAIKLIVVGWSHIQELDYEQLPFKCRHCHGYGHFARNCKKKTEEESEKEKGKQWTQARKSGTSKDTNKVKGKGWNAETGGPSSGKRLLEVQDKATTSTNPFAVLNPPEDQNQPELEEEEVQQYIEQIADAEINSGSQEQTGLATSEIPCVDANLQETHGSPASAISPLSYAEMIKKKKLIDNLGSSEEDSFERSTKKAGRKSPKEIREEEAERLKMQGSQSTIKISLGINTRARPTKGGPTPSFPSK